MIEKEILQSVSSSLTGGRVSTATGDACHEHHLGPEGANCEVGVGDGQRSGDQGAGAVAKVPAEADVCTTQILAGIVELDSESNGLVLNEVLVVLVDVVDLGEGYGEGNLVWWQRKRRRTDEEGWCENTNNVGDQAPVMVKTVEA